jgi:hypothetical protein
VAPGTSGAIAVADREHVRGRASGQTVHYVGDLARDAPGVRVKLLRGSAGKDRGLGVGAGQKGGELVGPNPTDRGKPGTKRHLFTEVMDDLTAPPKQIKPEDLLAVLGLGSGVRH